MKKVIIFESAIDSLKTFASLMGLGFKKAGYPVLMADMLDTDAARQKVLEFAVENNTVVIFFNHAGLNLLTEQRESIWNVLAADCYNLIVDHPMYYHEAIIFPIKKLTFLCVDRNHCKFLDRFYPGKVGSIFFPHGGIAAKLPEKPFAERTMDILFTGAYLIDDSIEMHVESLGAGMRDLWLECYQMLSQKSYLTLEQAVEICFMNRHIQLSEIDLRDAVRLFKDMDGMLRSQTRANVIKILADNDVTVHVYGEGWEFLDCKQENLVLHNRIPFDETIPLMADAKIILNVMPWFKAGIHDRVYSAMLNKGVCLTDTSEYIEQTLNDGEQALIFSLDKLDELPDQVKSYLRNPQELERIAVNGYCFANGKEDWESRARQLAQIFET